MLVLSVTDCPAALRGDLTQWLMEIDTGVYVGRVSRRVREELWSRVEQHLKTGRAILVYSANNEQRMDFRVHNAAWEPIDFDGIKLMLRPGTSRRAKKETPETELRPGYSRAAGYLAAKRMESVKARSPGFPEKCVIIDLETTGLHPQTDRIIEVGAIKYEKGQEVGRFQSLLKQDAPVPQPILSLTGIRETELAEKGKSTKDVMLGLIDFLSDFPIVSHNIAFDLDFLVRACGREGLTFPSNRRIDTLSLARRYIKEVSDYKLATLMAYLGQPARRLHRCLEDCQATAILLKELIKIRSGVP